MLVHDRDEKQAELLAREALERGGDNRFASAALSETLLRRGEFDGALEVIAAARRRFGQVPWYDLTLADALIEAGRMTEAEEVLEVVLGNPVLRRHALKRLSRAALTRGDNARARRMFEDLVAMAPNYLVFASDYVVLGTLQLHDGDRDAARATWRRGAEAYPRHGTLRGLLQDHFGENGVIAAPRVPPVDEAALGVRRIPVRTPMITPRTGLLEVVDHATAGLREPGDVIALSESAAAAGQGRMLPLELLQPGLVARTLCRFVNEIGPLHSPAGMQGAVMESGRLRVVLAAAVGGAGKAVGRPGWFYRVAGPWAAMIDDVAGCLPPHDHHVIFGPADPDGLSTEIAQSLGCPVAVVDANHRTGAWVVGASAAVDRGWLARVLADNPAGNEDEQTPIVLV
ncbi:MAG TPA: tetratricopeptide repeat protein, partial [Acidimicrobiales bacterium]|nr:tetratricopeptide repeat protein [Acidimicrobiales bacterium]